MATTSDYKDYLTLARAALEEGGEQAADELRETARLHRDSIGSDRPQDADRFEQELGQVLDQNRQERALAQAAEAETEEPPVPTYFGNGANADSNPYTRPGLDPVHRTALIEQHEEQVEAYSDWLVEKHGAQTFEEHVEAYDTLRETSEITVTREDGFDVSVDFGEGVTVEGVDGRGMGRLAEVMADDPETAEAVRDVLTGDLDPDAIDDRLEELEGLRPMGSGRIDGRSLPADLDGILTPELAAERDRLTAVAEALDAQAVGAAPAEVLDILTGHLAPDPAEDLTFAQDLILDMLPVVGEIRSIREGVEDFDGMTRAVEDGDWEEAARLGLFGVLGVAGGIPVLGKGFKAGRAALVRAYKSVPDPRTLPAAYRLNRRMQGAALETEAGWKKFFPTANAERVFGPALDDLPADVRSHIKGSWSYIMGEAGERAFRRDLDRAGFSQIEERTGRVFDVEGQTRIYDAVVQEDMNEMFGMFLLPGEHGAAWKGLELKINQSKHGRQAPIDTAVNMSEDPIARSRTDSETLVSSVNHFRERIDQVPFEQIEEVLRDTLGKKKKPKWATDQIDAMVDQARRFHSASTGNHPITFGMLLIGLAALSNPAEDRLRE